MRCKHMCMFNTPHQRERGHSECSSKPTHFTITIVTMMMKITYVQYIQHTHKHTRTYLHKYTHPQIYASTNTHHTLKHKRPNSCCYPFLFSITLYFVRVVIPIHTFFHHLTPQSLRVMHEYIMMLLLPLQNMYNVTCFGIDSFVFVIMQGLRLCFVNVLLFQLRHPVFYYNLLLRFFHKTHTFICLLLTRAVVM